MRPLSVALVHIPLVEGIHAIWASLQVESALRDPRIAALRGFATPKWQPPIVRPSDRIMFSACSSGRQRYLLWVPEVTNLGQVYRRPLGCPPDASSGTGAVRAGAHRRNRLWTEQGCKREVSAGPAHAG
ncbi:hypothetical protein NDU88_006707 [Pleurodeles waltl]|uniref:Uncharacterized protein n=1 Tax=Pleurodeles waltl TaxID=8319 RepID=A0AAV7LR87_PLEWA|nr:hypothetical protein NDU88_006707 [Pleurodeles waltl]